MWQHLFVKFILHRCTFLLIVPPLVLWLTEDLHWKDWDRLNLFFFSFRSLSWTAKNLRSQKFLDIVSRSFCYMSPWFRPWPWLNKNMNMPAQRSNRAISHFPKVLKIVTLYFQVGAFLTTSECIILGLAPDQGWCTLWCGYLNFGKVLHRPWYNSEDDAHSIFRLELSWRPLSASSLVSPQMQPTPSSKDSKS